MKFPTLKFAGLTNGTLITEERARLIFEKFQYINISIDSPIPEIYARIRVGANLKYVKRNILRITDLKRKNLFESDDPPRLGLFFIIMELTYQDISEMVDFALDLDAMWISFQAPWPGTLINQDIFKNRNKVEEYLSLRTIAEEKIKNKKSRLKIIDRTINTTLRNFPDLKNQFHFQDKDSPTVGSHPTCCSAPWEEILIDKNGDVMVCCTSLTILGNVNELSIKEIWNSPKAVQMRERIMSGNYSKDCKLNCVRGYKFSQFD